MNLFKFVGGEFVDPEIPESMVTFHFSLFAKDLEQAKEGFNEIFPGCVMLECSCQKI